MIDDVNTIVQNATIERMEAHEHEYDHGEGLEKLGAENDAFKAVETVLEKLPPEEAQLFHEYFNASANEQAGRNYYLYQAGFRDGVKFMKEILKW